MAQDAPSHSFKAVIFDIGGVVVGSPIFAINAFEKERGLPFQYLNVAITAQGKNGSFQRFERSELDLFSFYRQFGAELSNVEANNKHYQKFCKSRGIPVPELPQSLKIDGRELFGRMMQESVSMDPKMATAIQKLKESGRFKVAALTNNFSPPTEVPSELGGTSGKAPTLEEELKHLGVSEKGTKIKTMFDHYIESAVVGMRKPDPEFYKYALNVLKVRPEETIFLDDIGPNLKSAQNLGIHTIRVDSRNSFPALEELSKMTGLSLLDGSAQNSSEGRAKL